MNKLLTVFQNGQVSIQLHDSSKKKKRKKTFSEWGEQQESSQKKTLTSVTDIPGKIDIEIFNAGNEVWLRISIKTAKLFP